jgi:hypothetical protein
LQLPSYHKTLRSVSVGATIARRGESCNATFRSVLNAWTSRVPSATGRARALQAGDPPTRRASCWPKGGVPNLALRSFARHLRALNRSDNTVASYLDGVLQAEALLASRGPPCPMPDAPAWRQSSPISSGATRPTRFYRPPGAAHPGLLAGAGTEMEQDPCRQGQATIVPEQAVPVVLEEGLLAVCADKGIAG